MEWKLALAEKLKTAKSISHLISSARLMTCIFTLEALVGLLEAEMFMTALAELRVHNVDLDVFMLRYVQSFLQVVQSLPFARGDVLTFHRSLRNDEVLRHHLNNSVVIGAAWRVGVDEGQVVVADTQNQVLWPCDVVVFVARRPNAGKRLLVGIAR